MLPPWTVEPRFPPPLSLLVSLLFLRPHTSKAPLSWPPPIIRFDRHQRENLLCEGHARLGGENLPCAPAQPGSGIDRDWQQHVFQHCLSRLSSQGRPLVRYHDSDAVDVVVTRESTQGDRQNTSSCSPPFPSLHPYLCHTTCLIRGSNVVTGLFFPGAISKVASTLPASSTPKRSPISLPVWTVTTPFPLCPKTVSWRLDTAACGIVTESTRRCVSAAETLKRYRPDPLRVPRWPDRI